MQKHAVILVGGKQYLVQQGTELFVENLNKKEKETLELPVLMSFTEAKDVNIGTPELKTKAKAEIVENLKGDKIRVSRFKAKVRYRKVTGFRPQLTKIKITNI